MHPSTLDIAGRQVGGGHPCFVIAEAGVNHNGNLQEALRLVNAAADSGADAVKFQTFKAVRLATATAPQAAYQQRNTGSTESQLAMLQRLELSQQDHERLIAHCQACRILFLSTPFDHESADLLDALGVAAFKISSGDVTNLPLLEHVAAKGKPIILSTGMCNLGEVETAVETLERAGGQFALLHCVSNYPTSPDEANLRAMLTIQNAFGAPVGYSDHTEGTCIPMAAVALGASILEKHFTMDRTLPGPDHAASLEPDELARMIAEIRAVEAALGTGRKRAAPNEIATADVIRKSLVAARDIAAGEYLTDEAIAIMRPGTGLPPSMRPYLLGRVAREAIAAGALFQLENVA